MAATSPPESPPASTARFTFDELCAALREHRDITEAGLALGLGTTGGGDGEDRKRARDVFAVHFRRASERETGEVVTPGEWLTRHCPPSGPEFARSLLRHRVKLDGASLTVWTEAVELAVAGGARTPAEILSAIATGYVRSRRRR